VGGGDLGGGVGNGIARGTAISATAVCYTAADTRALTPRPWPRQQIQTAAIASSNLLDPALRRAGVGGDSGG
jgi:hypothetical protein